MKKRIVSGMLAAMMVFSLAACGTTENANNTTTQKEVVVTKGAKVLTAADYKEYITLGDYKNIEVNVSASDYEVTEDDIQAEINTCLKSAGVTEEIKEGTVADGDTINMDFKGLLDGVAFAGGTATDTEYTVGGNFIKDLDRALVGLEVGKEYELPCRFPDNYGEETLNGKDVIFVVTVNYIIKTSYPEYNDDFVKQLTAGTEQPLNTTAELEEQIKTYLKENADSRYKNAVFGAVMSSIINESEIKSRPESDMELARQMIKDSAEYEATSNGFDSLESYMTGVYGYASMADFEAEVEEYAQEYVDQKMVAYIVADNEGIKISDDDMKTYAEDLVTQTTYKDLAELIADYGEEAFWADVEYQLLFDRVADALVGFAKTK